MKTKRQNFAVAGVLAAFLAGASLHAADQKLSDWEIGETLVGEKVSMKDLKGQVVVFEYWGTR